MANFNVLDFVLEDICIWMFNEYATTPYLQGYLMALSSVAIAEGDTDLYHFVNDLKNALTEIHMRDIKSLGVCVNEWESML
jgi:hypothetical protein